LYGKDKIDKSLYLNVLFLFVQKTPDIMEDSRFTAMFKDSDFHIDTTSEEFRLLNPVVSKLDKAKKKRAVIAQQFDEIEVHYDFRITYIYQRVCE
jgi:hypothetical protein